MMDDLLSELANRIANVTASGSPSLTSAAAFQTQLRSEPTLGESFISGTTRTLLALVHATLQRSHRPGRPPPSTTTGFILR